MLNDYRAVRIHMDKQCNEVITANVLYHRQENAYHLTPNPPMRCILYMEGPATVTETENKKCQPGGSTQTRLFPVNK